MSAKKAATPLFMQALGLILATLAAAWATSGIFIFLLPQPAMDIYRVSEVAEALRLRQPVQAAEGGTLTVTRVQGAVRDDDGPRSIRFKTALAARMGVDESQISLANYRTPRWALRAPQLVRTGRGPRGADRDNVEPVVFSSFRVAVREPDGGYIQVQPSGMRLDSWQTRTLLVYAMAALIVSPLAWLFTRRLTAPIATFAKAAERLGRDPNAPPLDLRGSSEVNDAVEAFNNMQSRLGRYVEDRATMIGAIAHDLRTPLTRMRFRIESVPEEIHVRLAADIDQMDQMISAALAFVRDTTQPAIRAKVQLSSLVKSVIDEAAETGSKATLTKSERVVVDGDSLALRRMITNLVDNAVQYGGSARASLASKAGFAVIEIEDDGPGTPVEDLERLFEPFYRHEPSRSRETGGIGLGLAVVRSIARAHGGDVTLHNRAGGGLLARAILPL